MKTPSRDTLSPRERAVDVRGTCCGDDETAIAGHPLPGIGLLM
jgi:hypothetical protein